MMTSSDSMSVSKGQMQNILTVLKRTQSTLWQTWLFEDSQGFTPDTELKQLDHVQLSVSLPLSPLLQTPSPPLPLSHCKYHRSN